MIAPPWIPVPPRAYGGIEAVLDTLCRALTAAGHEVVLAASGDSTCDVKRLAGFSRSNASGLGMTLPELGHVTRAYAALRDRDLAGVVDIIHDHTLIGPASYSRDSRVPTVTTAHGAFTPEISEIFRGYPAQVSIVAISKLQARLAGDIPIARIIHHGITISEVPEGKGDGGYACFLGRMNPSKGVREAIKVARHVGMPLKIAAKMREPGEVAYFDQFVRPLLSADIEYLGELTSAEKFELLGSAVAMVNPIQWDEPFGMVMIEALATGTPVIATTRGSAPEIIEDGVTGFLRDNEYDLADALAVVHAIDRSACRSSAAARFSSDRMARDHLDLYQGLIDTSRLAPTPAEG